MKQFWRRFGAICLADGIAEEIFVSVMVYSEENFVYLLSYVLAPRSSDVSSQFRCLQPDRRVARGGLKRGQNGGGTWKSRFLRQYLRNITPRRCSTYSPAEHVRILARASPTHSPSAPSSPSFRNTFLSNRCKNEPQIPHYWITELRLDFLRYDLHRICFDLSNILR